MEKFLIDEKRQHVFTVEADIDGERVKGNFKCKYPSVKDELKIHVLTSAYTSGSDPFTLINSAYELAQMMARTEVLLIEKPGWYDFDTLVDTEVIGKVYAEVDKFCNEFRQRNAKGGHSKHSGGQQDNEVVQG